MYLQIKHFIYLIFATSVILCSTAMAADHDRSVSMDDPWQGFNRPVFNFNEKLDEYILRPVASGYRTHTPEPVQHLVSNFFNNLGDIRNFFNAVLQLKLKDAGISLTRFVINSTVGQLGLVDVASPIGIKEKYQDFGLTLARWNVGSGPYLVLPLLGPSTLRSAVGKIPDSYAYAPNYANGFALKAGLKGADIVQKRADLIPSESIITGDKYSFIRDAYLQRRQFMITGKQPQDTF